MKILTLNTWTEKGPWIERWDVIFDAVAKIDPDIIAFQEIFNPEWARQVKERLKYQSLAYLPDSEISGLMVLSKFAILKSESFRFKSQSSQPEPRRFLLRVQLQAGNFEMVVFNTHLTWRLNEGEIRCGQIDEILKIIENEDVGRKIAVCGDYNSASDTPEVQKMKTAGFIDTYDAYHPGKNELTWDNANPYAASAGTRLPDRRIDFVFTKGFGEPKSSKVVLNQPNENGFFASDHYGILTEY